MSKPHTPAIDESPELKALRDKYGSKLATLKDIYSTWSDEDLLSVLGEVNGNVDTAAERIVEGESLLRALVSFLCFFPSSLSLRYFLCWSRVAQDHRALPSPWNFAPISSISPDGHHQY